MARVSYSDMHCVCVSWVFSIYVHKKLNLWLGSSWQWFIFIHHCPLTGLNNYSLSYHLRLSLTFGCLCPAAHLCWSLYLLINRFVLKITLKVSDPELLAVSLYSSDCKIGLARAQKAGSVLIFKTKVKKFILKLLRITSENYKILKAIMKDVPHCAAVFITSSQASEFNYDIYLGHVVKDTISSLSTKP